MPAVSIEQLLEFEGHFEDATEAILEASGIATFISQEAKKIPLLDSEVSFDMGPALEQLTQIPKPTNWPAGMPPPQEYFRFTGNLEITVACNRDNETAPLPQFKTMIRQLRGKVRATFLRTCAPFRDSNLPFYRVSDIRPNGASTGTLPSARNVDYCTLRFVVTFSIKPDAWPVWVES